MNRSISESQLMQKLMISKKILEKLDGETYSEDYYDYDDYSYEDYSLPVTEQVQPSAPQIPSNEDRVSKIMNSGLPDDVKKAMIESPIQQQTMEPQQTFNPDMLNSARRLMNEEKKKLPQKSNKRPQPKGININPETLIKIITETVEKVLDSKLNQITESQKSEIQKTNETLVLKVGNNLFKGKITEVKQIK